MSDLALMTLVGEDAIRAWIAARLAEFEAQHEASAEPSSEARGVSSAMGA